MYFYRAKLVFPTWVCHPENQIYRIETIFAQYFLNIMLIVKITFFMNFCHTSFFSKNIFFWIFFDFLKIAWNQEKSVPDVWCNPFWIRLGNKESYSVFNAKKCFSHTMVFKKLFFVFSHFLFPILMHIHRVTCLKISQNLNSYLNEAAMCPQTVGEQIFKFKLYLYQSYLIIPDGSILSRDWRVPPPSPNKKIVILIKCIFTEQN